ncbi:MAG: glycogen-binding domain-containing protein [Phycisphaeraceae bacterium]|nr:glycogen-binding domain-containing protein [Phycisphaeraceae bacterium]
MVTVDASGRTIFRVFFPHAASVELVGSFTDWAARPIPMSRQHPGWWLATVPLPPGAHTFAYRVDRGVHVADYAAHGVEQDAAGAWISRLNVAPPVTAVVEPKPAAAPASARTGR